MTSNSQVGAKKNFFKTMAIGLLAMNISGIPVQQSTKNIYKD